ncbi:hypothetical protein [Marinobacterium sp. xm-d-579]|uniref:hypothetical protein n=1 Tax=Marinobacterium sp. xm-d-579 TaxID=2497734 RepID=UPI0015680E14|nr:hypothetical protein [Marinobacterium sp. xm-d-579]
MNSKDKQLMQEALKGSIGDDFQERQYNQEDVARDIAEAADHGGMCSFCCSEVPRRATVCASCGAVWMKEPTPLKDNLEGWFYLLVFVVSAIVGFSMESWIAFFVFLGLCIGLIIFSQNALKGPEKHVWSRRN